MAGIRERVEHSIMTHQLQPLVVDALVNRVLVTTRRTPEIEVGQSTTKALVRSSAREFLRAGLGKTREPKSAPSSPSRSPTPCRFNTSHLASKVSKVSQGEPGGPKGERVMARVHAHPRSMASANFNIDTLHTRWTVAVMRKDAFQRGLPAPDEVCVRHYCF
jgi:hypothetical protein